MIFPYSKQRAISLAIDIVISSCVVPTIALSITQDKFSLNFVVERATLGEIVLELYLQPYAYSAPLDADVRWVRSAWRNVGL
jgi:hypothetical protein